MAVYEVLLDWNEHLDEDPEICAMYDNMEVYEVLLDWNKHLDEDPVRSVMHDKPYDSLCSLAGLE